MNKPSLLRGLVSRKVKENQDVAPSRPVTSNITKKNPTDQVLSSMNLAKNVLRDRQGYGEREYLNSLPNTK